MKLLKPGRLRSNEIDLLVSKNFRDKRMKLKISLRHLAEATGVSIQQIAKYERGENRISCGILGIIAETLKTPITYFFNLETEEKIGHEKSII